MKNILDILKYKKIGILKMYLNEEKLTTQGNSTFEEITGITNKDLIKDNLYKYIHINSIDKFKKNINDFKKKPMLKEIDIFLYCKFVKKYHKFRLTLKSDSKINSRVNSYKIIGFVEKIKNKFEATENILLKKIQPFDTMIIDSQNNILYICDNIKSNLYGKHINIENIFTDIEELDDLKKIAKEKNILNWKKINLKIYKSNTYMYMHNIKNTNRFFIYFISSSHLDQLDVRNHLINISHEVKTPINNILGTMKLLLKTKIDEKQKDYVDKTEQSAKMLLHIINNILEFSRLDDGRLLLEENIFYLHDLLEEVSCILYTKMREKNLKIKIKIDEDAKIQFIGDSLKLKQILINLVSNSIKFTDNGYIKIEINVQFVENKKITLLFSVEDTGIGINKDEIQILFDPFTQANSSIRKKYGGTGLGLSISKSLVNMFDGEIWCDSLSGCGTVFRFNAKLKINEVPKNNITKSKEKRILIVEDEQINQEILRYIISDFGIGFDIVDCGYKALDQIKKEKYKIVILDVYLPDINGTLVAKLIKQINKDLVIIISSADSFFAKDSLNESIDDILIKPIDYERLSNCIKKWLK